MYRIWLAECGGGFLSAFARRDSVPSVFDTGQTSSATAMPRDCPEETLDEEKQGDQPLTEIARSSINEAAASRGTRLDENEEEEEPRRMRTGRGSRRPAAADRGRSRRR